MDLMTLLFLIGVAYAFRSAIEDVRAALGESTRARLSDAAKAAPGGKLSDARQKSITRRHALSWWFREIAQGFPVLTAGWAAGWHAHRQAAADLAAQAAKAKADGAEQSLRNRELIREHRKRAAAAKAAARSSGTPAVEDDTAPPKPTRPAEPDRVPHCSACGHPGRPGDELVPTPEGWQVHESHFSDPSTGFYQPPSPPEGASASSPEGRKPPMPTGTTNTIAAPDITYDELQSRATKSLVQCEVRLQQLRIEQWTQAADQLTGALRDGKTVGNIAQVAEETEREIKDLEHKIDTLQQFKTDLKHDHGGMNEAHQNAPVPGAHPSFYEG